MLLLLVFIRHSGFLVHRIGGSWVKMTIKVLVLVLATPLAVKDAGTPPPWGMETSCLALPIIKDREGEAFPFEFSLDQGLSSFKFVMIYCVL